MERKIALVTGASRGIGRSIALALAENGYDVGVNYLSSKEQAEEVCKLVEERGGKAICIQGNIGKLEDIDRIFSTFFTAFDHIDLLVNNAGVTKYLPILEATEELWDEITNTDWKGCYFCTQRAARKMVEKGTRGVILNITSIHQLCNFPISNIYGPTKAAMNKFSQHAALELAQYGIRVNSIAPGCTKIREGEDETPRGKMLASRIPLGRYGCTEEVADAVLYLASDKAQYITGTCLMLDGGAVLPVLLDNKFVPGF